MIPDICAGRLARCAAGLLGFYLISLILMPLIREWLPGAAGAAVASFIQMFYITFLFPLGIRMVEKAKRK